MLLYSISVLLYFIYIKEVVGMVGATIAAALVVVAGLGLMAIERYRNKEGGFFAFFVGFASVLLVLVVVNFPLNWPLMIPALLSGIAAAGFIQYFDPAKVTCGAITFLGNLQEKVKAPGLRLVIPLFEGVIELNGKKRELNVEVKEARTKSGAPFQIGVGVTWGPDFGSDNQNNPQPSNIVPFILAGGATDDKQITDIMTEAIQGGIIQTISRMERPRDVFEAREELDGGIDDRLFGRHVDLIREEASKFGIPAQRLGLGIRIYGIRIGEPKVLGETAKALNKAAAELEESDAELRDAKTRGQTPFQWLQNLGLSQDQIDQMTPQQRVDIGKWYNEFTAIREGRGSFERRTIRLEEVPDWVRDIVYRVMGVNR